MKLPSYREYKLSIGRRVFTLWKKLQPDRKYWEEFQGDEFHYRGCGFDPIRTMIAPHVPERGKSLSLMCGKYAHVDSTVGLDISLPMLSQNAEIRQGVVADNNDERFSLPFRDASFASAVMISGFGYLRDPNHTVSEMHRVLQPGGECVVGFSGGYLSRVTSQWRLATPPQRIEIVIGALDTVGFRNITEHRKYFESGHPHLPEAFDIITGTKPT